MTVRHLLLLFLFADGFRLYAQPVVTATYSCEQPTEIRTLLNLTYLAVPGGLRGSSGVQMERLRQLAAQYPADVWLQRYYIDNQTLGVLPSVPGDMVSEYRRHFEARPDDAESAYLYAYTLVGKDTPAAIRILTELTVKAPEYPF